MNGDSRDVPRPEDAVQGQVKIHDSKLIIREPADFALPLPRAAGAVPHRLQSLPLSDLSGGGGGGDGVPGGLLSGTADHPAAADVEGRAGGSHRGSSVAPR